MRSGAFLLAGIYTVGSVVLGLIAVWGGSWIAEVL
jgi:fluoride ion exporter CrcB/FEX